MKIKYKITVSYKEHKKMIYNIIGEGENFHKCTEDAQKQVWKNIVIPPDEINLELKGIVNERNT